MKVEELVKRLRGVDHMSVEDCFLQSPLFGHAADKLEELAAEVERLKEDRARFPDRPDDIGRMIEAHIGNLKEGKKSAEALADKAFDRALRAEAALAEVKRENEALRDVLEHVTELLVDTWNTNMEGDPERQMAVRDARAALAQGQGGSDDTLQTGDGQS